MIKFLIEELQEYKYWGFYKKSLFWFVIMVIILAALAAIGIIDVS